LPKFKVAIANLEDLTTFAQKILSLQWPQFKDTIANILGYNCEKNRIQLPIFSVAVAKI
jgi:hypothetical protein